MPIPALQQSELMLSDDKLFVVLAVVLVIWIGIVVFLFCTDRKLGRLERRLGDLEARNDHPKRP